MKYICYYDIDDKNKRKYVLSAKNKIDYIISVAQKAMNEEIEIISAAETRDTKHHCGRTTRITQNFTACCMRTIKHAGKWFDA